MELAATRRRRHLGLLDDRRESNTIPSVSWQGRTTPRLSGGAILAEGGAGKMFCTLQHREFGEALEGLICSLICCDFCCEDCFNLADAREDSNVGEVRYYKCACHDSR
jgi:hypothetical protein